jgi:hypothetical protein
MKTAVRWMRVARSSKAGQTDDGLWVTESRNPRQNDEDIMSEYLQKQIRGIAQQLSAEGKVYDGPTEAGLLNAAAHEMDRLYAELKRRHGLGQSPSK